MDRDAVDFILTMQEVRVLRTVLKVILDRKLLPVKQHVVMEGLAKKMDMCNMGEQN